MQAKVLAAVVALVVVMAPRQSRALPWPGTAQGLGLHGAIKAWKSFDKCLARLTKALPSEVSALITGDTLEMICRAQQAVAEDDPKICQKMLKNYQVRKHCKRFYAAYTGRKADCPTRGYPRYKEGMCSALATRNPGLCRLVAPQYRPTCQGVLLGASHCKKSLKGHELARCQAAARAWQGVIKAKAAKPPMSFKASLEIKATALSPGVTIPPKGAKYQSSQLDQGVLVANKAGKGDWFVINHAFAPTEYYVRHKKRGPITLQMQVPLSGAAGQLVGTHKITGGPGGSGKISFSTRRPRYRYVRMDSSTGSVTLSRFDRKVGGTVAGTFWLVFSDGVDKVRLEGKFKTFVRELVPLKSVASYMRYRTGRRKRYRYSRGRMRPDELKKAKARIRKINDTRFDVDPSLRNEIVADTAKIRYAASISKRSQGGYKLYTVYRNSVLWQLGLRDRDIVLSVNKRSLDKPEDVYAAYGKLKKSRKLVFELERGSKTIKITYRIRRVRIKKKKKKKAKPKK